VSFTLAVPGVNAFVGPFMGANTQYIQGTAAVTYNVDGQHLCLTQTAPRSAVRIR
jgi:hypothetical protein